MRNCWWLGGGTLICGLLLMVTTAGALESSFDARFKAVSQKTRQTMILAPEELQHLLKQCDQLLVETDGLAGSKQKIMKKRVKRLQDLLLYVIEQQHKSEPASSAQ